MSGLLLLRALLFAGEGFAASLLLPVLAFAVTAGLRRAALRHLVWVTMFGVLAVLPVAALLLPPRRLVEHAAAPAGVAVAAAPPPSAFTIEHGMLLLAALWLAGLIWQALRLCVGGLGLWRLRRASVSFAVEWKTGCAIRLSSGEDGPSTFGLLRPVIVLPRAAQDWTAARLDAVLRHEAAHVARRDTLSQGVARLVCAVFWPNPLLWLALRALRREAEIAADDAVLASGLAPSAYAAELLALAAEGRGLAPGIAMAGSALAARVEAVLAANPSRKGVTRMDMARTVSLGLAAALLLGAARFDIAVAQDAQAPSASALPDKAQPGGLREKAGRVTFPADKATRDGDTLFLGSGRNRVYVRMARDDQAQAQADAVKAQADQVRAQMAQVRPQVEQALASARISETVIKALADAHVSEIVAKALADAHIEATVAKAVADAHIDQKIAEAMAQAQPKIQAAVERAERAAPPAPPAPPAPLPPRE